MSVTVEEVIESARDLLATVKSRCESMRFAAPEMQGTHLEMIEESCSDFEDILKDYERRESAGEEKSTNTQVIKLVATADNYSPVSKEYKVERRARVNVPKTKSESASPGEDSRLDALEQLINFYRTRVGTRFPLPQRKLVIEFSEGEENGQ